MAVLTIKLVDSLSMEEARGVAMTTNSFVPTSTPVCGLGADEAAVSCWAASYYPGEGEGGGRGGNRFFLAFVVVLVRAPRWLKSAI